MNKIKCPRCNREAKLEECVSHTKGRKRIILSFPCFHYACLVYNVSDSTDNNTIIKDFNTISKEYFDKTYYIFHSSSKDRYLN